MCSDGPYQLCRLLTVVDGETEEIVDLIEIKGFELSAFARQFDVPVETDPEMLERYAIGPDDAPFVFGVLGFEMKLDFARFGYFIEAAQKDT
jgi:hypothetical protein